LKLQRRQVHTTTLIFATGFALFAFLLAAGYGSTSSRMLPWAGIYKQYKQFHQYNLKIDLLSISALQY